MNEGNQSESARREQIEGSWPPVDALVISVRQPWAWLIINAGKDIENRDWFTKVRGRVLIHAGKGMTREEYAVCLRTCHMISGKHPFPDGMVLPAFDELERGGIIGSVEIVDCVDGSASPWFFGRYGFVLRDPQPLPFQPCKGQLGFFRI